MHFVNLPNDLQTIHAWSTEDLAILQHNFRFTIQCDGAIYLEFIVCVAIAPSLHIPSPRQVFACIVFAQVSTNKNNVSSSSLDANRHLFWGYLGAFETARSYFGSFSVCCQRKLWPHTKASNIFSMKAHIYNAILLRHIFRIRQNQCALMLSADGSKPKPIISFYLLLSWRRSLFSLNWLQMNIKPPPDTMHGVHGQKLAKINQSICFMNVCFVYAIAPHFIWVAAGCWSPR